MTDPRGYRADKAMSYVKIERIARARRKALAPDVALDSALPVSEIFEWLDDQVVKAANDNVIVGLDYGVVNLPRGVEGRTQYDRERRKIAIELDAKTYEGLKTDQPRARMTVGHEMGHADLHTDLLLRISVIPHHQMALQRGSADPHPFYIDTEWQAGAYAGALLMPARGIAKLEQRHGRVSVPLLQETFLVSAEAANIRLANYHAKKTQLLSV
jgi:Zn-dependent peptidase ImmA (M78 family)